MSMVYAERPSFFNGQYLGAEDLEAFLRYAREQEARHLLGSHTWGIVAGIDLVAFDPIVEGLGRTANLGRDGLNGRPQRWVLPSVLQHHANSALAYFG